MPVKTEQGWLSIYHGVFGTMDGSICRLGAALHGLRNLQPEDPWEVTGYVHKLIFTCIAVPEPDGTVKIYWAARTR